MESTEFHYVDNDKKGEGIEGVTSTNKIFDIEMKVSRDPASPQNSLEIAFYKGKKLLGVNSIGMRDIPIDTNDIDFWEEFNQKYVDRFVNLEDKNLSTNPFETVFPDIIELRENRKE